MSGPGGGLKSVPWSHGPVGRSMTLATYGHHHDHDRVWPACMAARATPGTFGQNTKVQSGVECQEMGECQIRLPLRINPAEVRLQIIKAPEFYQET